MYKSEHAIRLKVTNIEGLFDSQDPQALPARRLNSEWLEYIFEIMNDKPGKGPVNLMITANTIGPDFKIGELPEVLREEFKNYDKFLRRRLKENFRVGRISLGLTLFPLIICIFLSEATLFLNLGIFQQAFREGFLIIGWVALWRPVEILLYDWWPIAENRRKIKRILLGRIEINSL